MNYYLEVWLRGFAKDHLREISSQESENYHPHITFVRPFEIKGDPEEVKKIIIDFCSSKQPIYFVLQGKNDFEGKIKYVPIEESERLLEFNNGLEEILNGKVIFSEKLDDDKILHATVDFNKEIEPSERIEQYMLRLTAIRDKKIWFSYDFVTEETLTREESLNKNKWYRTVHEFSNEYGLLPTRNGFGKIPK